MIPSWHRIDHVCEIKRCRRTFRRKYISYVQPQTLKSHIMVAQSTPILLHKMAFQLIWLDPTVGLQSINTCTDVHIVQMGSPM